MSLFKEISGLDLLKPALAKKIRLNGSWLIISFLCLLLFVFLMSDCHSDKLELFQYQYWKCCQYC